jgi:hypothetical protein
MSIPQESQSTIQVGGSLAGWELALVIGVVAVPLVLLAWPIVSAWASRLRSGPTDAALAQTQQEVDSLTGRLADLERRLEFAERLLPRPATGADTVVRSASPASDSTPTPEPRTEVE